MATLGVPQNTIAILQKYQFHFQKKFGQNFLIDTSVLERIMEAAQIGPEDCVLEIGPGIGTMTQYLAENAGSVIAVEIDKALIPILEETLAPYENITVIQGDILKLDIRGLAEKYADGKKLKVVANLPYYITTPIIMGLFEKDIRLSGITVMVQKEVAERMQAKPGTKDYGALSLAVQYYAEPRITANVPPNCFMPRPAVGSAVIHLKIRETSSVKVQDEKYMFDLIRAAFNQRRKTLPNALMGAAIPGLAKENIANALQKMQLPETIRGEKLSLEDFAKLSDLLGSCVRSPKHNI